MYILQNTKTKEFFCEFHEQTQEDTAKIEEAADFIKRSDAHLLRAHLEGDYSIEPKGKFINQ